MMKPDCSCFAPSVPLSPLLHQLLHIKQEYCFPPHLSYQFSEGEGVNTVKTLEFSATEVL